MAEEQVAPGPVVIDGRLCRAARRGRSVDPFRHGTVRIRRRIGIRGLRGLSGGPDPVSRRPSGRPGAAPPCRGVELPGRGAEPASAGDAESAPVGSAEPASAGGAEPAPPGGAEPSTAGGAGSSPTGGVEPSPASGASSSARLPIRRQGDLPNEARPARRRPPGVAAGQRQGRRAQEHERDDAGRRAPIRRRLVRPAGRVPVLPVFRPSRHGSPFHPRRGEGPPRPLSPSRARSGTPAPPLQQRRIASRARRTRPSPAAGRGSPRS